MAGGDLLEQLERLAALRVNQHLTDEEFAEVKGMLLADARRSQSGATGVADAVAGSPPEPSDVDAAISAALAYKDPAAAATPGGAAPGGAANSVSEEIAGRLGEARRLHDLIKVTQRAGDTQGLVDLLHQQRAHADRRSVTPPS
eukprot:TRINITY_DN25143_c0_g1_i1.p1 TRINITY_DN25143_c0_g1~~TRINITY_DN25143_c0_g1_i1.p1  ORF type:complete len:144 (+),score=25.20 TRINITY_DN25143_c0_g1_i1:76-507(+)